MTERGSTTDLHATEEAISRELLTSATTTRAYQEIFRLTPDKLRGITMVDIGAGASPFVSYAVSVGADAYAVDRLYGDEEALLDSVSDSLPKVIAQTPPNYQEQMKRATVDAISQFSASYDANPDRYLHGWFTELPFPDEFADVTISLNAISGMGSDPSVLQASVLEGLRITKPNGTFVMAAYHTRDGRHHQYWREHRTMVDQLRLQGVGQISIVRDVPKYQDAKLVIRKKKSY